MQADAFEEVTQVGEWVHAQSFAGGDEAGQHRGCAPAIVAAQEHPILSAHRDSAQAALRTGMPTSGLCRAISPPTDSERVSAALIVADAA